MRNSFTEMLLPTHALFLTPVLLQMLFVWPFLYEKCPPFIQARISFLQGNFLPLELEIHVDADEESIQEPVNLVRMGSKE